LKQSLTSIEGLVLSKEWRV